MYIFYRTSWPLGTTSHEMLLLLSVTHTTVIIDERIYFLFPSPLISLNSCVSTLPDNTLQTQLAL